MEQGNRVKVFMNSCINVQKYEERISATRILQGAFAGTMCFAIADTATSLIALRHGG